MLRESLRIQRLLLALLALLAVVGFAGCGGSTQVAQEGDSVSVHYHGTLDSGEVFDSSRDGDPLPPFVVGSGSVIAGFDEAVRGLAVGESVTVRIEPGDAYGEHDESLVFDVPVSDAPEGLKEGDQVMMDGGRPVTVLEISDTIIRIDANHALAGQALTFEIELVKIN
jgi:FKBP-type peptidyl-prolyl cis-trans isomerase 2